MVSVDRIKGLSSSLAVKVPVLAATTAPITLSGLQTIDGVSIPSGGRVLVKDQVDPVENGWYDASTSAWQRSVDADNNNDLTNGTLCLAAGGTTQSGIVFRLMSANTVLPGTDALSFRPWPSAGNGDTVVSKNLKISNPDPNFVHKIIIPGGTSAGIPKAAFQSASGGTVVSAMPSAASWADTNGFMAYSQNPAILVTDAQTASLTIDQDDGAVLEAGRTELKLGGGSWASFPAFKIKTSGTDKLSIAADTTGTYTFNGTAPRIIGDFSNATMSNRLMFQSSTLNGNTIVGAAPNGTGIASGFRVNNAADADNASYGQLSISDAAVSLTSGKTVTGAYVPLNLVANGVETLRLDLSGNSLHLNPAGGLGYGVGAGGSATQTTSKGTAVTLNRPCGQITMHNEALAAGASVFFNFSNTLISRGDTLTFGLWVGSVASTAAYRIETVFMGPQLAGFKVTNISAGTLSEALAFNFALIKGSNT